MIRAERSLPDGEHQHSREGPVSLAMEWERHQYRSRHLECGSGLDDDGDSALGRDNRPFYAKARGSLLVQVSTNDMKTVVRDGVLSHPGSQDRPVESCIVDRKEDSTPAIP